MSRKAVFYLFDKLIIILTILLFVAACACRHAATVSPVQNTGWMLFALALPGILAVNLAAVVWWLIRRRWLVALLPVAALLVNIPFISAMVQPWGPTAQDEASYDLKVATYNVHGFRGEYGFRYVVEQVGALLAEEKADVVCLEEFRTTSDYDTLQVVTMLGYPYAAYHESVAVLSRYPLSDTKAILFKEKVPNKTNGAIRVDITTPSGRVRLVACHLQTTGLSSMERVYARDYGMRFVPFGRLSEGLTENARLRAIQADQIAARAKNPTFPVIVAGDFNDIPSSYTYYVMTRVLEDTFRENGRGWGSTYRGAMGLLRLDYIFTSSTLECTRCYSLDTELSDHKPVFAALKFRK